MAPRRALLILYLAFETCIKAEECQITCRAAIEASVCFAATDEAELAIWASIVLPALRTSRLKGLTTLYWVVCRHYAFVINGSKRSIFSLEQVVKWSTGSYQKPLLSQSKGFRTLKLKNLAYRHRNGMKDGEREDITNIRYTKPGNPGRNEIAALELPENANEVKQWLTAIRIGSILI